MFSGDGSLQTVLVVDDNRSVLHLVTSILKDAHFDVLSASSGADALRVSESNGVINLLLSDVIMPEISGQALGQLLKKARPEMCVMLMSDGDNRSLIEINDGWAYIQKPFAPTKLVEMVTSVLSSQGRLQRLSRGVKTRHDLPKPRRPRFGKVSVASGGHRILHRRARRYGLWLLESIASRRRIDQAAKEYIDALRDFRLAVIADARAWVGSMKPLPKSSRRLRG
jgi:DNA-binding response OmpR family regulator